MTAYPNNLTKYVIGRWNSLIGGEYAAPSCPPEKVLRSIINVCYQTSALPEESRYPKFNVIIIEKSEQSAISADVILYPLEKERSVSVSEFRRLAPATDWKKSAIWVIWEGESAKIAGIADLGTGWHRARSGLRYHYRVPSCLLLQVDRPARVKVYQGQYNVANLIEGVVATPEIMEQSLCLHRIAGAGLSLLEQGRIVFPIREHPRDYSEFAFMAIWNVYASIANMISQSEHGGSLILLADDRSVADPFVNIKYKMMSQHLRNAFISFINVRNRLGDHVEARESDGVDLGTDYFRDEILASEAMDELTECIRYVAQLAGCDGAIVLTPDLELIGFGAEIKAELKQGAKVHESVGFMKTGKEFNVEQFGMRHRAAIKLVSHLDKSVCLAISQDGPITAFWSDKKSVLVRKNMNLTNMNMPMG